MTDNANRPIEFLLKARTDDASFNHTLSRMDDLSARIKEAKALAQDNYESSRLTLGEQMSSELDEIAASTGDLSKETDKAAESFERLGNRGDISLKKLTKLLTQLTVGVIGAGVAASASFASTYGGVDPQATAQMEAQKHVKTAFDDLGRVTSRLVTPALISLARVTEGAAVVLDKLFPQGSDNPVSYFFDHTIPDAGHAMINLIGTLKILGESIKVSVSTGLDTLVTNFQILILNIGKGISGWFADLQSRIDDLVTNIKIGALEFQKVADSLGAILASAVDDFTTNIKLIALSLQDNFGRVFNTLLTLSATIADSLGNKDLAKSLLGSIDVNAIAGSDGRSRYNQMQEQALLDRSNRTYGNGSDIDTEIDRLKKERAGRTYSGNAAYFDNAISTAQSDLKTRTDNAVSDYHKAIDQIATDTETANKAFDSFGKVIAKVVDTALNAPRITREAVDAFIKRNVDIAKANKDFADQQADIEKRKNADLTKAAQDRDKALAELDKETAKRGIEIHTKAADERLKVDADFADTEARIEKQADLKREQDLRAHQLRMDELAASGDVAGFVQERLRFNLQQQNDQQTAALEKQDRANAYTKRRSEIDKQEQDDLKALQQSGDEKRNAIAQQYTEQTNTVKMAARDQLAALKTKHDNELVEIDRAFAEQLAQLDGNLAGLNDARNADYTYQEGELQKFINKQQGYLQQLYNTRPGAVYNGLNASQVPLTGLGGFVGQSARIVNNVAHFANGAIQNTVGDLLTASAFANAVETITGSISQALQLPPSTGQHATGTGHIE